MDDPGPAGMINVLAMSAGQTAQTASAGLIILKIIILLLLILVNAFFAMSEIAIISLNDNKIEKRAEEGDKKAKQVQKLTSNSSNFLSTIQIGVTLAGFLTSASAADSFAPMITAALAPHINIPESVISTISIILITIVMSYFSLVFGELAPKKIAMRKSEKVSYKVVGFLLVFMKITKPFVKVLSGSTNAVVKLFGIDPADNEENVTEEEILMMVDVGEEKGVIENTQAEMINNIFEFDDIDAGDIMTHRVDMTAVEADEPVSEVIKVAMEDGYSRIPVFDDDPDNIIGIVYVKDLLKYIGKEIPTTQSIREVMRAATFVPETKKCGELFTEMSEKHIQIAIVVDEYGGTAGLVTLEDLLESIVGNIQDEYDNEDDEIARINDNTFTVDGTTAIDEVDELIGAEIPDGDYDTIGGYIISELGYLPKDGDMDTVEYDNIKLTVLSVEDKRIAKVRIEITPKASDNDEDKNDKEDTDKDNK